MTVVVDELKVDGNTSGAVSALGQLERAEKSAIATTEQLSKATAETGNVVAQIAPKISTAGDAAERLRRAFVPGASDAAKLTQALGALGTTLKNNESFAGEYAAAVDTVIRRHGTEAAAAVLAARGETELASAVRQSIAQYKTRETAVVAANENVIRSNKAVSESAIQFRKQVLGQQLLDIGQSTALGMPLGMVAMQQGPQIAGMYAGNGGIKAMLSDIGAMAGSAARAIGPIGIALAAAATAAGAYFYSVSGGEEKAEADLAKHVGDIEALAKAWGDQLPSVQAYYNGLKRQQDLQEQRKAVNITEGANWQDATKQFNDFYVVFQRAYGLMETTNNLPAFATATRDFQELEKKVKDHTATLEDAEKVSKDLSDVYAKMPLDVFNKALSSLKLFETELDSAKQKSLELNNEFAKFGGLRPMQVVDLIHNRGSAFQPVPENGPVPQARPPFELEGDDSTTKSVQKAESAYDGLVRAADARIKALQQEIQYSGLAADVRARLMAQDQAQAQYEEAIAAAHGKKNQDEINSLRALADAQARLQQQLAGANFDQGQQEQIKALQLQADLIGKSVEEQNRMNAVFQANLAMQQAGLSTLDAEADKRRAIAAAIADASTEIERQKQAFSSLQQTEGSVIDDLVTGTGTMKDRLKAALSDGLKFVEQMALANPIKNAMAGVAFTITFEEFSV